MVKLCKGVHLNMFLLDWINYLLYYWLYRMYCQLPIAGCLLPIACCLLHIAYCLLPIAGGALRTTGCLLHFAQCIRHRPYCLLPSPLLPIAFPWKHTLIPNPSLPTYNAPHTISNLDNSHRPQQISKVEFEQLQKHILKPSHTYRHNFVHTYPAICNNTTTKHIEAWKQLNHLQTLLIHYDTNNILPTMMISQPTTLNNR